MFDSQLTVVGNLVADPRLSTTPDGSSVASFRIASTRRWFDRATGEWRDGDTLYANVTCWRGLAENVVASLKKGQSAVVLGRLSVRPYETKDGEKRQSVEIDAQVVASDLSRAISLVKKAERATASGPGWLGVDSIPAGESGGSVDGEGDRDEWRPIGTPAEISSVGGVDDEFDDVLESGPGFDEGIGADADVFGSAAEPAEGALVGAGFGAGVSEASEVAGSGGRRKGRFGIG
jgi:single-strand DNA-binding protein